MNLRPAVLILAILLPFNVHAAMPDAPDDVLRGANTGDAESQVEMGILYEYGFRLKDSKIIALAWYLRAAEQGNARAARYRDRVMKKLSPAQIARAREKSKKTNPGL